MLLSSFEPFLQMRQKRSNTAKQFNRVLLAYRTSQITRLNAIHDGPKWSYFTI